MTILFEAPEAHQAQFLPNRVAANNVRSRKIVCHEQTTGMGRKQRYKWLQKKTILTFPLYTPLGTEIHKCGSLIQKPGFSQRP